MNIKLVVTTLLFNIIIFVILVFGLGNNFSENRDDLFLFSKTSLRNLNQKNLVNYNYPYNMLITAEPHSIFMTEGGDNQVFSILYFALVERRRPDIDFFDQKGNVFPRLYGDFFQTSGNDVLMIRELRDFQLFSTERPVYLTWRRPGMENLSIDGIRNLKSQLIERIPPQARPAFNAKYKTDTIRNIRKTTHAMVSPSVYDMTLRSGGNLREQDFKYLGPWYLKPVGLLFRVTPIRYAVVDVLEILNGSGTDFVIRRQVENLTKVTLDDTLYERMISALEEEGYVKRSNAETVQLQKPFHPLETEDKEYWENYTFAYNDVPNAPYWERLARDIYASYAYLKRDMHLRYAQAYQTKASLGQQNRQEATNQVNYFQKANEERQKVSTLMLETAPYLYDNNSFMYDIGNLLNSQQKRLEAVDYYERSAKQYYPLTEPNFIAASILLDEAYKNWEERAPFIKRALSNIEQAADHRKLYFELKKPENNIERDPILIRANALKEQAQFLMKTSPQQLAEQKKKVLEKADRQEVRDIAGRYIQLGKTNEVISLYESLIRDYPNRTQWYLDFISYIGPHNKGVALTVISRIESAYASLDNPPKLWEFEFTRGILLFRDNLDRLRKGTALAQLTNHFIESQERLERYLESASEFQDDPAFRKRIIQSEKTIQYIKNITASGDPAASRSPQALQSPNGALQAN